MSKHVPVKKMQFLAAWLGSVLFLTYSYATSRAIGETIQCNNSWISNIVQYNLYVHMFFVGGGEGGEGGVGCVLHLHSPLGDLLVFYTVP